ncbi:hypothetical protein ACOI1C_08715 [Bacillus sp. DJP31]|uniref:hypothetical protein n=1 Tax=Bacillus sp. DJP31 TaxID=3409789 RepID=UPI003BB7885A
MYKKVNTSEELTIYNNIWMECWEEKGYEIDFYDGVAERFLISNSSGVYVGTIEVKEYTLNEENEINTVYPFHELDYLKENMLQTIEVDKAAILKEHRSENLHTIIKVIGDYAMKHKTIYCVGLFEEAFFTSLRDVYKIPIIAVGDPFFYKGDDVIPTLINLKEVFLNIDKYSWLLKIPELK